MWSTSKTTRIYDQPYIKSHLVNNEGELASQSPFLSHPLIASLCGASEQPVSQGDAEVPGAAPARLRPFAPPSLDREKPFPADTAPPREAPASKGEMVTPTFLPEKPEVASPC